MIHKEISVILLDWYILNKRDFPWRHTADPYKILVAEKLLQQTAVGARVVRAYNQLIDQYPSVSDLAQADDIQLAGVFTELGLPYRAKELLNIAKRISNEFDNRVPDTREQLLALPGVGEYIARALLSFGYNFDFAIVDTNVSRFLYRLLGLQGKRPQNPARSKRLIEIAQSLLPVGNSREYNFAVLDLCAILCVVSIPHCSDCPLQFHCSYNTKRDIGENFEANLTPKT